MQKRYRRHKHRFWKEFAAICSVQTAKWDIGGRRRVPFPHTELAFMLILAVLLQGGKNFQTSTDTFVNEAFESADRGTLISVARLLA